jgi:formate/nitrite transporter
VLAGADPGHGPTRLLAGMAFALGLILVVVGGAELFTGNALLVMAWVDGIVTGAGLLRNWSIVFAANFAGAIVVVSLASLSGLADGELGRSAARLAEAKLSLGAVELFARAVLCNALVCLAVWLSFAARDVPGKILAVLWPVAAFVALGFEHSVANMFLLPFGRLAGAAGDATDIVRNLVWVTLGNVAGGAGGVALSYWAAYRRGARE